MYQHLFVVQKKLTQNRTNTKIVSTENKMNTLHPPLRENKSGVNHFIINQFIMILK